MQLRVQDSETEQYLAPFHVLVLILNLQGVGQGTKSGGPEPQDKQPSGHHIPQYPQAKLNLGWEHNTGRLS